MSHSTGETVIVRDRDGIWQLPGADAWTAMTLVGALSADPRSLDELARAWLRYRPDEPLADLPWAESDGRPVDGPWLVLDLAHLRIVAGGGAELPENSAAFQRDEGPWNPEIPVVWTNWSPDWQCVEGADWDEALPPLPVPSEPLEVRGILFGRALAEGIAQRALDMARREPLPEQRADGSARDWTGKPSQAQRETMARWHALTIRVHADWLMTPREDLGGQPPRTFLHLGRDWVEQEIDNRQQQWTDQRRAPRPLDRDTFAYRYGPLGRHEVVMYFDLCREVINAAWDRIVETPDIDQATLTDFLHAHAKWWLEEGSIDGNPTPPATIIENERRRMPLIDDGSHLDCDCPICRMELDGGFGPMFCGFDGHHLELDDEFAFSLCATREEWEEQQGEFGEFAVEMEPKRAEREAEGAGEPDGSGPFASVWTSSYVNEELVREAGPSSPLSTMALAIRTSELVSDLKETGAPRELIEALNNAFDAYRAAGADPALSKAAATPLIEALEQIASAQPNLTAKAADLQSQLDERNRQIDSDSPF